MHLKHLASNETPTYDARMKIERIRSNCREFRSLSVLLPVVTETESLAETIRILRADCAQDLEEFILLVCARTTGPSLALCQHLAAADPSRIRVHFQGLPFLGGAFREGFELARGTHIVMMASDLETDPRTVLRMVQEAKQYPASVIVASRWLTQGSFKGYGAFRLALNFTFQKIFAVLYGARLTDLTFGLKIFPAPMVNAILWEELGHPFCMEALLKPLRLGFTAREVPTAWRPRTDGVSQHPFCRNFAFAWAGLRIRLSPPARFTKDIPT